MEVKVPTAAATDPTPADKDLVPIHRAGGRWEAPKVMGATQAGKAPTPAPGVPTPAVKAPAVEAATRRVEEATPLAAATDSRHLRRQSPRQAAQKSPLPAATRTPGPKSLKSRQHPKCRQHLKCRQRQVLVPPSLLAADLRRQREVNLRPDKAQDHRQEEAPVRKATVPANQALATRTKDPLLVTGDRQRRRRKSATRKAMSLKGVIRAVVEALATARTRTRAPRHRAPARRTPNRPAKRAAGLHLTAIRGRRVAGTHSMGHHHHQVQEATLRRDQTAIRAARLALALPPRNVSTPTIRAIGQGSVCHGSLDLH
jgi:hypothetical protein